MMVSLQALKSLRQWDNPFNYFQAYIESGNDFRELQPILHMMMNQKVRSFQSMELCCVKQD
jgi:hypothetical protein